jgi:hypothetical protein
MNFKMEFEPTTAFVINAWYTRDIKCDKDKQKDKQPKENDKCMTQLPQMIIDFFSLSSSHIHMIINSNVDNNLIIQMANEILLSKLKNIKGFF